MEKERAVIYTITSLDVKKVHWISGETFQTPIVHKNRTVGWFPKLETAQKCVEEDWADFDEGNYYNYIVIEKNVEGLYNIGGFDPDNQTEWWYQYDRKQDKWIACEKPEWSKHTVGWGLG